MISVLIPNYNNSLFLRDCFDSISQQDIPKNLFEIIVCDDCSSDDSLVILEDYKSILNFKLLFNKENRGVGYTKRILVEESCGQWFIFLDSDDKFCNDCLSELYNIINTLKDKDVSMIYANSYQLMLDGTINCWERSKPFIGSLLDNKFEYPIFHPIIYNRFFYNLTEGIDTRLKSADDFDLWYKLEEVGEFVFYNKPLYYYRVNQYGVSQVVKYSEKWLQVMFEHAFISANAATRRGLDIRSELNQFANVIISGFSKTRNKSMLYRLFLKLKFSR
jgi:glycosyltransferase involved in cell wall biosynthesis